MTNNMIVNTHEHSFTVIVILNGKPVQRCLYVQQVSAHVWCGHLTRRNQITARWKWDDKFQTPVYWDVDGKLVSNCWKNERIAPFVLGAVRCYKESTVEAKIMKEAA